MQVSLQGDRIVLYTKSRACSKESGETEYSIHGAEASWKLKDRSRATGAGSGI